MQGTLALCCPLVTDSKHFFLFLTVGNEQDEVSAQKSSDSSESFSLPTVIYEIYEGSASTSFLLLACKCNFTPLFLSFLQDLPWRGFNMTAFYLSDYTKMTNAPLKSKHQNILLALSSTHHWKVELAPHNEQPLLTQGTRLSKATPKGTTHARLYITHELNRELVALWVHEWGKHNQKRGGREERRSKRGREKEGKGGKREQEWAGGGHITSSSPPCPAPSAEPQLAPAHPMHCPENHRRRCTKDKHPVAVRKHLPGAAAAPSFPAPLRLVQSKSPLRIQADS